MGRGSGGERHVVTGRGGGPAPARYQRGALGTGLPTANNTHQIAQQIAPHARIVYVDNDPLVLVHAEALLTSAPGGITSYIEADVRDPDTILREAAGTLDL